LAFLTKVGNEWHQVTKMGAALPPPPTPKPGDDGYDYRSLRQSEYEESIPFGDQADALLKWTTAVRMKQSAIDNAIDGLVVETSIVVSTDDEGVSTAEGTSAVSAASLTALKAALSPVFDLPADLDAVVGKWTAVKAKFPKE